MPLYAYCFLLGGSIQLCVCNFMHNDFLDSLNLDLWACVKHAFLFFFSLWIPVYFSLYQYLPRVNLV